MPQVHKEMQAIARRHLRRENPDHTLQPTALVNEAYIRLIDQNRVQWQNRAHFLAVAARMMRRILVDHARKRRAGKRGAGEPMVEFDEALAVSEPQQLTALDEALSTLAQLDQRQSQIVELRYFGGLSIKETAEAIGVSPATVKREWSVARVWLSRELSRSRIG